MVPLNSLGQDDQNEVQHAFVLGYAIAIGNFKPIASSMAPLNSLAQDDQNEVQHDFWSCDTFGINISNT